MPLLRAATLAIVALWFGGLMALGVLAAPPAQLEQFRRVAWWYGGVLIALLLLRATLGPRPRRLSIQVGLVAVMLAANVLASSPALTALTVVVGLTVFWIEAREQ
jgi:hypothetical protein